MEPWRETRERNGQEWVIGREPDAAWINQNTNEGATITIAIPPLFDAYWGVQLPYGDDYDWTPAETDRIPDELVELLASHTEPQPWWLGFLDRWNTSDVIFDDAAPVAIYNGGYVLIQAGAEQARRWRGRAGDRVDHRLPDITFPQDRSWLTTTLWDDHLTYFGGARSMQRAFRDHPLFGSRTRLIDIDKRVLPKPNGER